MVQLHSFGVYYGPIEFELEPERPWMYKRNRKEGESEPGHDTPGAWSVTCDKNGVPTMPEEGVAFQKDLQVLFPPFAGGRIWTRWNYESSDLPMRVRLHVLIPNRCRLAAVFEDLDYFAPIWVNVLAVIAFALHRLGA